MGKKEEQRQTKNERRKDERVQESCTQVVSRSQEGAASELSKESEISKITGLDVPGSQTRKFSPSRLPTGGRLSLDVDREGGRELSIELAERRMKTHAVERNFSEALREGKAKRKVQTRKRSSGSQEESIVTRLLKEKAQEKAGD